MKIENKNTGIYTDDFSTKDTETKKTVYRTKNKAGDIAEIPNRLPVITNSKYQYAMTFNKNDKAYLQKLSCTDSLNYTNGLLLYKGQPITANNLNDLCTDDGLENINLSLLRAFYGIKLNAFAKASYQRETIIDNTITFYYPDFAKKIGKSSNIGKSDVYEFIKNIKNLQTVVGIINNETRGSYILPVIIDLVYDAANNTIKFKSPYITKIINEIHEISIKRDQTSNPILKKNGEPQMLPAYSYLLDMSIVKEKNKKAVEIVLIVVALIEQAGDGIPHIRAQTIVDRNRLLTKSLAGQPARTKNTILKRTFKKAWELLEAKTSLESEYQLPNPDDISKIPTSSKLYIVFDFLHKEESKSS